MTSDIPCGALRMPFAFFRLVRLSRGGHMAHMPLCRYCPVPYDYALVHGTPIHHWTVPRYRLAV